MATVTQPKMFNHEENQRHVRHPLQLLRKYIRTYIILEGLALTLLAASVLFWIGLFCDFGLFKLDVSGVGERDFGLFDLDVEKIGIFGVDWILELNDMDLTGAASLGCRIVVLTVVVIGLLALGFTKVVWRWVREFNDRSLALILERRFPKQLGDRLITAIELADPKLSQKYGYSQAMVEKTIEEAVETLKTLPVAHVFNWRRLYSLWALVGVSTLGLFLLSMTVVCVGSLFTENSTVSPYGFAWRFYDVGAVWTERNVMMKNTYWPRKAHLEIEGFQRSKDDDNDMRIAKDDARRPDLRVRAIQWVIADTDVKKAPYGWRSLTWQDLKDHDLIDESLLTAVTIPKTYDNWLIDTEEIEPNLRKALFGEPAKASPKTSGEMREFCALPKVHQEIIQRGAVETLDQWLDWRQWTVDKIKLQDDDTNARTSLRNLVNKDADYHEQLQAVFAKLEELADSPMMSRTIRKLEIPKTAEARFRSPENDLNVPLTIGGDNKALLALGKDIKGADRFKLRVRGENYFTSAKTITLVAATTPKSITVDKEEPAYIYYRIEGMDQSALRGQKHTTTGIPYPSSGGVSNFEVPLGTNFTIHVESDRKLRGEHSVSQAEAPQRDRSFDGFAGTITVRPDRTGFSLKMIDITRNHDFLVEFFDEDNIRGEWRFKIMRTLDFEPLLGKLAVFDYVPRRPRFKAPPPPDKDNKDNKDKETSLPPDHTRLLGAFLITRDAMIPFECAIKDDYGLVHVSYHYKYRTVDAGLLMQGGSKKRPRLEVDPPMRRAHANIAASHFQFWPGNPLSWFGAAAHLSGAGDIVESQLRVVQKYKEGYIACEGFDDLLERRKGDVVNMVQVKSKAGAKDAKIRPWDFDLKDSLDLTNGRGTFDVREYCKGLQQSDPEFGPLHYLLEIAVQAGDNNVETGRDYTHIYEKKVHIKGRDVMRTFSQDLRGNTSMNENSYLSFLIVTENELLAQISLDEIAIAEKLGIAQERVDEGMTSLLEQLSKTRGENVNMESILIRMNEIRTALGSAGNSVRDAQQSYDNILKELKYNRVSGDRKSSIENNIIRRLDAIVAADERETGSLPAAENAFQEAHQLVEADANAKRAPDVEAHRVKMNKAHREMQRLSNDIKGVLDAMSEGIYESKLKELLAEIEKMQLENSGALFEIWRKQVEKLLGDAVKDSEKVPEKGKDTPGKLPEKKVGQLQAPTQAGTESLADASCIRGFGLRQAYAAIPAFCGGKIEILPMGPPDCEVFQRKRQDGNLAATAWRRFVVKPYPTPGLVFESANLAEKIRV